MSQQSNLELQRQVFHLQTLYEIASALHHCKYSSEIYREVLSILMGTFGVEHGLALLRSNQKKWSVIAERGFEGSISASLEQNLNTKFQRIASSERASTLQDWLSSGGFCEASDNPGVWVEFPGREQLLGGIFLGTRLSREPYSSGDHELIAAAASQIAIALDNLRLNEELREAEERLHLENIALREEVLKGYEGGRIIGQSESILKVLQQARVVAKSPTNVLIFGETGTGKELLAKTIHYLSPRKDRPFVAVNCTAIPDNLVESELFGIEAGVATGVKKHIGFFEQADGGTIFIDEIGDMPLTSQAKILRALQERRFRRLGGTREIAVDVRVVVATNKDLEEEMRQGNFRDDLYYRLSVLELHMPPLRNRRDDIALLVNHFVKKVSDKIDIQIKGFSQKAIKTMNAHDWPGNVRELENQVERAITLAGEGAIIQPEDLSLKSNHGSSKLELPGALRGENLREAVDALETFLIKEAMNKYNSNKSEVSRRLGLSRLGLQKKMERLGIQPDEQGAA